MRLLQSIMQYNGGSVIAMVGKDCVAIASDLRLGQQSLSLSSNFQKVRRFTYFMRVIELNTRLSIDIPRNRPHIHRSPRSRNGCNNTVRLPSVS